MKVSVPVKAVSLLVLVHAAVVTCSIIERDFFGRFTLEQGSLPFCLKHLTTYADYQNFSSLSSIYLDDSRDYRLSRKSASCSLPSVSGLPRYRSSKLIRAPASKQVFGDAAYALGDVYSLDERYECFDPTTRSFSVSNSSTAETTMEPSPEPFFSSVSSSTEPSVPEKSTDVKFTAALPTRPTYVKGLRLSPEKRYIFVESASAHCIYSAQALKRLQVQATYSLVRSPLLKTPPSYCKSSLTITGKPGVVDASQLLFDGRPDTCLKGKLTLVEPPNIKIPVVTNLVQQSIPYYGYSETPLHCGNRTVYAGAAEISRDGRLGNVFTVKGAKYFGMVELPRNVYDTAELLSKIGICLYTTATEKPSGGFWGNVKSALG